MGEWLETLDWGQVTRALKGKKKKKFMPGEVATARMSPQMSLFNALHCPVRYRV